MENNVKSYEISLWKDVYEDGYYKEEKIMIIGSDKMGTSNRVFSPIFTQNKNGEKTLEFSLYHKVYNEYTNILQENPFIPYLVNERKVKLKYGEEWFDFIIKEREESSDNTFTYKAVDANVLELSKKGYNLEFSTEVNNNQGTIIELGKKVLEDTDWTIDEENSDIIRSYMDEPVYLGTLVKDIRVKNLEKDEEERILEQGSQVFIFYSFVKNKITEQVQIVPYEKTNDKFNYIYDDKGVALADNYLVLDEVKFQDESYDFVSELTLFQDFQFRKLSRKQESFYDPVTERVVDVFEIAGREEEIHHYKDTIYTTSDVLTNYITNGSNFQLSIKNELVGWDKGNTTKDIELQAFPSIAQIAAGEGRLDEVRNYLKVQIPKNSYIYNNGINDSANLIQNFVKGEKYSYKIKLGTLSGNSIVNKEPNLRCVVAGYSINNDGNYIINNNEIIIDFRNEPYSIENIVVDNGTFVIQDGVRKQYVVEGEVLTPDIKAYYKEKGSTDLFKWDIKTESFKIKQDLNFYRINAECKNPLSNIQENEIKVGIFIFNESNENIPYYIEEIQLFKYIEDGENKPMFIGSVPVATNRDKDYYFLKPDKDYKKQDIELYNSKKAIAEKIGISEETISPKYDKLSQAVSMIEAKDSNYFDILQSLCEKFECWMKIEIDREEDGSIKIVDGAPSKKIAFKKYVGKDNWAGFKYGINLKEIQRTFSSEEIVTKLIIPDNNNQYAENGFCSVVDATSNIGKLNYILNFDYYINQGLLDKDSFNINDFYESIGEKNKKILSLSKKLSDIKLKKFNLDGKRTVYEDTVNQSKLDLKKAKEEFKAITKNDYEPNYPFNEGDIDYESLIDIVHRIVDCNNIINNYKPNTENLNKEYNKLVIESEGLPSYTFKVELIGTNNVRWTLDNYFKGFKFKLVKKVGSVVENEQEFETSYFSKTESINFEPTHLIIISMPQGYKKEAEEYSFSLVEQDFILNIEPEDSSTKEKSLKSQIEKLKKEKDEEEKAFLNKFGSFLQEGTWNSEDYLDGELYYLDAIKASYENSKPKVEYNINVIEVSSVESLPDENYEIGLSNYNFEVGDKTYIEDTEFFGYISIDGVPTPVKEEIIITEITHNLDDPTEDTITVANYKTQFEDLFQRLAATTQSIQYNEGSYARAASAIDVSGIINPQVFLNSLGAISGLEYDLTKDGIITIAKDGIIGTDIRDVNKKLKFSAGSIKGTTDNGETWTDILTPEGLNTDFLRAGSINTNEIVLLDGNQPSFRWDSSGLNAYYYDNSAYNLGKFVRFDKFGLYGINGDQFFQPSDLEEIKNKAHFGVTWDGFFIKNSYTNGYVSISSDNDFQVIQKIEDEDVERIKIGALEFNYEGEPIYYGIRIQDKNGDPIFETDGDGNLSITGDINATGGNFSDIVTVGNNGEDSEYIIIDGEEGSIRTSNYTDGAGYGWLINKDGDAVFNNITARGSIKTAVFEYAEIQAVGGIFLFRPSSTIRKARIADNGEDLVLEIEKPELFAKTEDQQYSWCKISNYIEHGGDPQVNVDDILENNGLAHVYQIANVDLSTSEVTLANGIVFINAIKKEGQSDQEILDGLEGGALVDMGREDGTTNYGIGVNSSDNTVNLPARAISLFETEIEKEKELKVKYKYKGILGTLPNGLDDVNSDIYDKMKGTQGIYTNNMYIGDANQYLAFYGLNEDEKNLIIQANQIYVKGKSETPSVVPEGYKNIGEVASHLEVTTRGLWVLPDEIAKDKPVDDGQDKHKVFDEIEDPDSSANPSELGWYEKENLEFGNIEYILTEDTVVDTDKTYYILVKEDSVDEVQENANARQSLDYKVLLANDGMHLYDGEGKEVSVFGESIRFDSSRPQFIGNERAYIAFDPATNTISAGGSGFTFVGNRPLNEVLAAIDNMEGMGKQQDALIEKTKTISFTEDGKLVISGGESSSIRLEMENERISFKSFKNGKDQEIAYITTEEMGISRSMILDSLTIGGDFEGERKWQWALTDATSTDRDHLTLQWLGTGG